MQGSFSPNTTYYNSMLTYIRTLRETPNAISGVVFSGYSERANAEYEANIEKYIVKNCFSRKFPVGFTDINTQNSAFRLSFDSSNKKYFKSDYSSFLGDHSKVCALALAFVAYGSIGSLVNKETYLMKINKAMLEYQRRNNVRLSHDEKVAVVNDVNLIFGLESYIFESSGKKYVLMEAEERDDTGIKQKSYTIVNVDSCANAIFDEGTSRQEDVRILSQCEISVDKAQKFVSGKLNLLTNVEQEAEAIRSICGKFSLAEGEKSPRVIFEGPHNSFTDYRFTVKSPASEHAKENGYAWR